MRQPALPGFEGCEDHGTAPRGRWRGGGAVLGEGGAVAGPDWEERCFAAGCAFARELAVTLLAALEAWLHLARPVGYAVEGWRGRVLVTRMGDLRLRRRLYRAPDGRAHFLLDEHLGWTPRQVATPSVLALLVDWATDVSFAEAARKLAAATAGALCLSGPTVRRHLHRVVARVRAAELATPQDWTTARTTGQGPVPQGERVVAPLYVEADGVHVKTQREPAHRGGYELKCASAYEGWRRCGAPTPGHPRAHFRLEEKRVYCHLHAREAVPFWEGASLALGQTYDLSALPLVVVGGDGAEWIDGAADVFPRVVRQRDGFHLARDAARGWGTQTGAALYAALRTGDQPTALELLALPAPKRASSPRPALPALPAPQPVLALPAPVAERHEERAGAPTAAAACGTTAARRPAHWTHAQVRRARTAVQAQAGTADAATDWRAQVAASQVPSDARALGTQEGTNAHLLARRMKHRGCSWSVPGAQAVGKARELVTNRTLAHWCLAPPPQPPPADHAGRATRRRRLTGLPGGRLPWPQVSAPAAHGPPRDTAVAHLHRVLQGGYRLR
jgi:Uncharacterised protein family (UPF0236)